MKRVTLTGDDVEVISRVAAFAEQPNLYERPALTVVYVRDGLAFATDAYRMAFGEVDCPDFTLPARCARWLPFDGGTLDITKVGEATTVSWEVEGGTVGGTYHGEPSLKLSSLLAVADPSQRDPKAWKPARRLSEKPYYRPVGESAVPAIVASQDFSTVVVVAHDFLRDVLKAVPNPKVSIGVNGLKPVWFWDDDITVLLMPIRAIADLTLAAA